MPIRPLRLSLGSAVLAVTVTHVAAQQPVTPSPPAGRGAGAAGAAGPQAPGRQGGGGRGPNFAQQQRPPGDPAVVARGQALYAINCTACHGADLRGGDQGGPNLLRANGVLTDQKGETIGAVIRDGRRGAVGSMPSFPMPESDRVAIAEYIHSVMARAGRQGRPPERDVPFELNVLVGDATAGQSYFARACSRCHGADGDLRGLASRVADPRELQNLWLAGGRGGSDASAITVTVTPPGGAAITGRLIRIDDFIVTLQQSDGARRTYRRDGAVPRVEIRDPLLPHRQIALELSDRDMHNITAYLATLQ